jgi:hypothetical protein
VHVITTYAVTIAAMTEAGAYEKAEQLTKDSLAGFEIVGTAQSGPFLMLIDKMELGA